MCGIADGCPIDHIEELDLCDRAGLYRERGPRHKFELGGEGRGARYSPRAIQRTRPTISAASGQGASGHSG